MDEIVLRDFAGTKVLFMKRPVGWVYLWPFGAVRGMCKSDILVLVEWMCLDCVYAESVDVNCVYAEVLIRVWALVLQIWGNETRRLDGVKADDMECM